ncbi:uncharacterized protein PODANS_6_10650, partial [Podospora anserina S mat+]
LQEWQQQHQQQLPVSVSPPFTSSPSSNDQGLLHFLDPSQDFDHLLWNGSFDTTSQQLALDCPLFDIQYPLPFPTLPVPDFDIGIPSFGLGESSAAPVTTTAATANLSLLTPTPTIITSFESCQSPSSSTSPTSTSTPVSASGNLVPGLKLPSSISVTLTGKPKGKSGRKPTKKRPLPEEEDDEDEEVLVKRARNNLAAKRYRQKKVDRIEELEDEVKEVKKERDDLRVELARREAEVKALREMLAMTTGKKD